jgi:hypothetical protein
LTLLPLLPDQKRPAAKPAKVGVCCVRLLFPSVSCFPDPLYYRKHFETAETPLRTARFTSHDTFFFIRLLSTLPNLKIYDINRCHSCQNFINTFAILTPNLLRRTDLPFRITEEWIFFVEIRDKSSLAALFKRRPVIQATATLHINNGGRQTCAMV